MIYRLIAGFLFVWSCFGCGSSQPEPGLQSPLEKRVPQYSEMGLFHVTTLDLVADILRTKEIGVSMPAPFRPNVFTELEYDAHSDWTTMASFQVLRKDLQNGHYWGVKRKYINAQVVPRNQDTPVLIEMSLSPLVERQDYTVAHNMNEYYGAIFAIDDTFPKRRAVPGSEVAYGDNPERVFAALKRDFDLAAANGDGVFKNEVIFRKAPVSLRTEQIRVLFNRAADLVWLETTHPDLFANHWKRESISLVEILLDPK